MPKEIRIVKEELSDQVFAGYMSTGGGHWLTQSDVTDMFIKAVIDMYGGCTTTVTVAATSEESEEKQYEITVKEIT